MWSYQNPGAAKTYAVIKKTGDFFTGCYPWAKGLFIFVSDFNLTP
jgi:hypothetical protein